MKTLLLIRHAKAEPAASGRSDHERALEKRGVRDAAEMGRRLKERQVQPGLIIASSALRAASTARLVAAELGVPAQGIVEDGRLYASSVPKMLYLIREIDDRLACVALVGHNPEMTELAQHFSRALPDMPTGAVARLDFELDGWSGIDAQVPVRVDFDRPGKGQD